MENAVDKIYLTDMTAKQKDVAQLVAKGYNNKQIANALLITEWGIKSRLDAIYNKYGIPGRTEDFDARVLLALAYTAQYPQS